jgi:hypothetical protein
LGIIVNKIDRLFGKLIRLTVLIVFMMLVALPMNAYAQEDITAAKIETAFTLDNAPIIALFTENTLVYDSSTDATDTRGTWPDEPDETTTITEPRVPLAQVPSEQVNPGYWALTNLILVFISIAIASFITIGLAAALQKSNIADAEQNAEAASSGSTAWRVITIAFGAVALVIFFITEDLTLPMNIADTWTVLMAAFLLIQVVGVVVLKQVSPKQIL